MFSKYYLPLKSIQSHRTRYIYCVCLIISCVHYVLSLLSHCDYCYCNYSNTRENNTGNISLHVTYNTNTSK